jgi:hexosaminidase
MNHLLKVLLVLLPGTVVSQSFRLAPPRIDVESRFFTDSVKVRLGFEMEGSSIFYKLEGKNSSNGFQHYTGPVTVKHTSDLKAYAIHPDFWSSEMAEIHLTEAGQALKNGTLTPAPDKQYPGSGARTLFDLKSGSDDLHDGNWIAFLGDTVVFEAAMNGRQKLKRIVVSSMASFGSWVLPPREIYVQTGNAKGRWRNRAHWTATATEMTDMQRLQGIWMKALKLTAFRTDYVRIRIVPFGKLPEEHPGAGRQAWLFLDEILFQ